MKVTATDLLMSPWLVPATGTRKNVANYITFGKPYQTDRWSFAKQKLRELLGVTFCYKRHKS